MAHPTALLAARGITIVLVVLFHAQLIVTAGGWSFAPYWRIVALLSYVLMPLFFVLAGISMSRVLRRDKAEVFLVGRATTYLYLYWAWTIINCAADVLLRFFTDELSFELLPEFLVSLVLPRDTLWFLYALAAYVMVVRVMIRLPRVAQLGAALALAALPNFIDMRFETAGLFGNFFFFLVGLTFKRELTALYGRNPWIGSAAAGILYLALVAGALLSGVVRAPIFNEVAGFVGVAMFIFASHLLAMTPLGPVLGTLGRSTLEIYLIHNILMETAWAIVRPTLSAQSAVVGIVAPAALGLIGVAGALVARRALRGVPGLFGAPPWAMRWIGAPLATLLEITLRALRILRRSVRPGRSIGAR